MNGVVHDEKPFSTDWGHWFKEGSYPGIDNGIRMLLDAETFDSGPGDATAEVNFLTVFILWSVAKYISNVFSWEPAL